MFIHTENTYRIDKYVLNYIIEDHRAMKCHA